MSAPTIRPLFCRKHHYVHNTETPCPKCKEEGTAPIHRWVMNITCPRCQFTADVPLDFPCEAPAGAFKAERERLAKAFEAGVGDFSPSDAAVIAEIIRNGARQ